MYKFETSVSIVYKAIIVMETIQYTKFTRFSDAADGEWQSKVDLSATTVVVPSESTYHIDGCCMRRDWRFSTLNSGFMRLKGRVYAAE